MQQKQHLKQEPLLVKEKSYDVLISPLQHHMFDSAYFLNEEQLKEEQLKEEQLEKEKLEEQQKEKQLEIEKLEEKLKKEEKEKLEKEKLEKEKQLQKEKKEELKKEEKNAFFYPKEKNSLFWCFFILKNGFESYHYPNTTSFINEQKLKFKCIESLREKKTILKEHKIKHKEDMEYELANKEVIGIKTFLSLCIIENIHVLLIHNKKCFEIRDGLCEEEDASVCCHVIHCIDIVKHGKQGKQEKQTTYAYEMNATKEKINHYRTTLFKWECIEKPLKALSAYKLNDLRVLYDTFCCIDKEPSLVKTKKTKKELYDSLEIALQ